MKSFAVISLLASSAAAWGVIGHEITATIAQMLLTEHTKEQLCDILPTWANCHLAPVAPWADSIKNDSWWRSWTSSLHYVDPLGDWPSTDCKFGQDGWHSPERNILVAINNYTRGVATGHGQERDYALRFLVHYLGDLHQPMHLTGRDRGGNNIKVLFDGTLTNLHSVWDDELLDKYVRDTAKYNATFPEKIEQAFRGTEYDPYLRSVVKEGLLGQWKEDYTTWAQCPSYADASGSQQVLGSAATFGGFPTLPDDPALPACPHHWAAAHQDLNCKYAFPPRLDKPNPHGSTWYQKIWYYARHYNDQHVELDIPEYVEPIRKGKVVEKQLSKGGVRLAAILNSIFDPTGPQLALL